MVQCTIKDRVRAAQGLCAMLHCPPGFQPGCTRPALTENGSKTVAESHILRPRVGAHEGVRGPDCKRISTNPKGGFGRYPINRLEEME